MRNLIVFTFCVCMQSACVADDLAELKLGAAWERVKAPNPETAGWTWHTWRNKRGDRLTIAYSSRRGELTSYADLDRAMDFASSAYPDWLNTDDFPSWRNPDHDFSPKFLKLKTDTTPTNGKRVPIISYVMVNDDHPRSFMANGRVVCIKDTTCYIQHNSKHPISDDVVIDVMRRLLDQLAP